ncbi:MAG: hypothetical protein HLUCCA11_11815 [Phormidesmis priestleyi Ana]|uniref:Uncharacterized protein n=1 Tax=Phormidesmis priestleyi Ana TaxID=1666911 RepID=A0A0P8DFJ4_9CYAN|nr:MAG: hypothetical protein HLUCCA11_11815 [Phormidesmis priestleyi Ana]
MLRQFCMNGRERIYWLPTFYEASTALINRKDTEAHAAGSDWRA